MGILRKSLIVILAVTVMTGTLMAFVPATSREDGTAPDADVLTSAPAQTQPSASPSEATAPSFPEGPRPEKPDAFDPLGSDHPVTLGEEIPGINARDAFFYDLGASRFKYVKGQVHGKLYPASVTKLFSAYVALMYLNPSAQVTAGKILETLPSDSSVALLSQGDRMTVRDLIYAMLLPSGGDAARVVAVAAGRAYSGQKNMPEEEAMACFVKEMNRQAKLSGMNDTHFVNPDGYHHEDHYTSLADIVTIGRLSMKNSLIMKAARTTVYSGKRLNCGKELQWLNTNHLLHKYRYPKVYCAEAIGLKTGFTVEAKCCLLSLFKKDGRYFMVGVFGCDVSNDRYVNTLKIYNTLTK